MRRVDLNLLYVLRELLKEPNTTKAGKTLGVTQSAVSAALGRLRWAFQDELFVRTGRTMVPTRRAETLLEPVENIIQGIEALLEEVHFAPETLERTFTLASADFLINRIAGRVIAGMHPEAPHTRLMCYTFNSDSRERVRTGHLDLTLGPTLFSDQEADILNTQTIYTDTLVAAVCARNDSYGEVMTEEEFFAATYVDYNANISAGWTSTTERFLAENSLRINKVAEFSTQMTMMNALRNSQTVALVPSKLVALSATDNDIRAVKLPFDVPEFEVCMSWNRSFNNDPEHQWFRGLVEEAAADLG